MKARDVREYLKTMDGGWLNWENTVDTFKSGDPTTEVRGIAVGWMGYTWTLQRALELDCNMFITHASQPTIIITIPIRMSSVTKVLQPNVK